jgi:hypothetical protein
VGVIEPADPDGHQEPGGRRRVCPLRSIQPQFGPHTAATSST